MSTVDSTTSTGSVSSNYNGLTNSVQMQFAMLQLELSESAKTAALDLMDEITAAQEEQAQVAALLQEARQLQSDAKGGTGDCPWDDEASMMTTDMQAYMDANGLAYDKTGDDLANNEEEWEVAIASLEARQEQLGIDTQQKMVFIEDYMSQYNSYLTGASSTISDANDTLRSILTN